MEHNLISIIKIVIGWKNKYATLCISHCLYHTYLLFRFDSRCHHALHTHKKKIYVRSARKKWKKEKKNEETKWYRTCWAIFFFSGVAAASTGKYLSAVKCRYCRYRVLYRRALTRCVCVRVLMCVCIFYLVHIRWIYCCIYVYIGTHWITFVDDTFSAHHFVHKFPLFPFFFSNFVSSDVYSGKLHTRERLNQMLTNAWTIFTKQMDDWLLSETTHETKRNEKSNSIQHNKQCIFSPCTLDRQSLNNLILKT